MLTYLDTAIGFIVVMLAVSLLITTLTQTVSAIVNHRGSNLRWGLKTLFANIDPVQFPNVAGQADQLAREVLSHCLISDSWFSGNRFAEALGAKIPLLKKWFARFRLASAIRPAELADILRALAAAKRHQAATAPADEAQALNNVAQEIAGLLAQADPAAAQDVRMAAAAAAALPGVAAAAAPVANAAQAALDNAGASIGRLEVWFGSMMDRVSQKFAMYMRLWTVGFACAFALISGLNTMDLLAEIYHNGVVRDALVGAGQQMTATAASALDPQNSLSAKFTAELVKAVKAQALPAPDPTPVIATTAAGTSWINANVPTEKRQPVLDAFNTGAQAAIQKSLADNRQTAQSLLQLTSKSGVEVVKLHWPPNFFHRASSDDWWQAFAWRFRYLLGVALTAILLSFGAPFWFNALKSLANLRPILASKQDTESQGARS
jgi:hypothetical protein